jgi:hypothetical protein
MKFTKHLAILTLIFCFSLPVLSAKNDLNSNLEQVLDTLHRKFGIQYGVEVLIDAQESNYDLRDFMVNSLILEFNSVSEIVNALKDDGKLPFKILHPESRSDVIYLIHKKLPSDESYVMNVKMKNFKVLGDKDEIVNKLKAKGIQLSIGFMQMRHAENPGEKKQYSINAEDLTVREIMGQLLVENPQSFCFWALTCPGDETYISF